MAAQDQHSFLPKEPLDLPKDPLDLPIESLELPLPQQYQQQAEYPMQIKTLLAWTAPGRPFRKRGKEYFGSIVLIALLLSIIAFLFSEYMLIMVILSLAFVAIALATVPPHDFHYRISTEGITIEDHFFLWQELYDFYFKKHDGIDTLHIRTHAFIPGELTITLGSVDREHLKSVLLPYLPFRELVKPTFMEKSGDWLSKNFPLERQPKPTS